MAVYKKYVNGDWVKQSTTFPVKIGGRAEPAPPLLQTKNITPSETVQPVTADAGFDALERVNVAAISSTYVGSGVTKKSAETITPSESQQTIAANQYLTGAQTIAAISPTYVGSGVTRKAAATITPTESQQTIAANQYLMGDQTIAAIQTEEKITTENGDVTPSSGTYLKKVTVNVPCKAAQASDTMARVNSSSLSATTVTLTVEKTGTYTVRWFAYRTNTGGTSGSRLYIGTTAYGSENTTFGVNSNGQTNKLTGVSLTAGQKITVYARSRSSSYYTFVMGLSIVEE